MISKVPFLRSPPFPWVDAATAAISFPGRSRLRDPDALFGAIRRARVGGAFWVEGTWGETAIAADPDCEQAIAAWIAGNLVQDRAGASIDAGVMRRHAITAIEAALYRDPFSGDAIDAIAAVAILAGWREGFDANRAICAAVGMAMWKRDAITQFLWDGRASPPFLGPDPAIARAAPSAGTITCWPSRSPTDMRERAEYHGVRVWLVEDGFLRSNGLGAECRPPMSILVDRIGGIHFDPERASELETILAEQEFDANLLDRARRLRHAIVAGRVGKYGVEEPAPAVDLPTGRRIVLAIGQVEDDLSVIHASAGIADTHDFLERVRAAEPDAFIVYRPHPDVAAGLRRGALDGGGLVDRVVTGGSLLALIEGADAVHVLSSLSGFEALLRDVPVTVHGMPFYAGWGLTTDLAPVPTRRTRRLTIDDLVVGALILAPRYRDPVTELPCTPETLVARLVATPEPNMTMLTGFRRAWGNARRTFAPGERRRA